MTKELDKTKGWCWYRYLTDKEAAIYDDGAQEVLLYIEARNHARQYFPSLDRRDFPQFEHRGEDHTMVRIIQRWPYPRDPLDPHPELANGSIGWKYFPLGSDIIKVVSVPENVVTCLPCRLTKETEKVA